MENDDRWPMSRDPETYIRRIRTIAVLLAIPRCAIAVAPIWITAMVFAQFSPNYAASFANAAGWLTCALLVATVYRQVAKYWIVAPDHVFFRDERRVAIWVDKTRTERTIRIGRPSELFVLKSINLALLVMRWGLLLAFTIGGFQYIWTILVGDQAVPPLFLTLAQWNLAGVFVFAIGFAIAGGVKIIRSSTVEDFPNTRAVLGRAN
jgi:hypothetical protein